MEEDLWFAAFAGREDEVRKILTESPDLDVNWKNRKSADWTALHCACLLGHDKIVSLLLAHPGIDVNQKREDGSTPFFCACISGQTACVRVLLADRRAMINEPDDEYLRPMYWVAYFGHLEIAKAWIVSGKIMNLGQSGDGHIDAAGVAEKYNKTEMADLLRRFKFRPDETRQQVKAGRSV